MKGLAITSKGIEKISKLEVKELLKSNATTHTACTSFDVKKLDDLVKFTYLSQSSEKVLLLLKKTNLKELESEIKKLDLKRFLKKKTFRVSCKQIDNDQLTTDLAADIGEIIFESTKAKVDLSNPDIIFFIFISKDEVFFGLDLSNFELQKRQYRIFPHQASLRSTLAYAVVRLTNYNKSNKILDPFCGSGTIPIEAALYALNFPVNFFDKDKFSFQNLKNYNPLLEKLDKKIKKSKLPIYGYDSFMGCAIGSRKNAKIAGVDKQTIFSKVDISWLDTKFKKGEIDIIATHPPEQSQNKSEKDTEKLYNELFYQAEFVLKKTGIIATITRKTEMLTNAATKYKFKLKEQHPVFAGKDSLTISLFIK